MQQGLKAVEDCQSFMAQYLLTCVKMKGMIVSNWKGKVGADANVMKAWGVKQWAKLPSKTGHPHSRQISWDAQKWMLRDPGQHVVLRRVDLPCDLSQH